LRNLRNRGHIGVLAGGDRWFGVVTTGTVQLAAAIIRRIPCFAGGDISSAVRLSIVGDLSWTIVTALPSRCGTVAPRGTVTELFSNDTIMLVPCTYRLPLRSVSCVSNEECMPFCDGPAVATSSPSLMVRSSLRAGGADRTAGGSGFRLVIPSNSCQDEMVSFGNLSGRRRRR
jgi:hypothetical protein